MSYFHRSSGRGISRSRIFCRGIARPGLLWGILLAVLFSSVGTLFATDILSVSPRFDQPGKEQPFDWRVLLHFNRPVSQAVVEKNVSLLTDGKADQIIILNATAADSDISPKPLPTERSRFVLAPKTPCSKIASGEILLDRNLTSVDGAILEKQVRISFRTFPSVEAKDVKGYYTDEKNRGVSFQLPADFGVSDVKEYIRIMPPVGPLDVSTEPSNAGTLVTVKARLATAKRYRLMISGGLVGNDDQIFRKSLIPFIGAGPRASILFMTSRSVLERISRQQLPVGVMNVDQLRTVVTRVPAIFTPEFSSLGLFAKNDVRKGRNTRIQANDKEEELIAAASLGAREELDHAATRLIKLNELAESSDGKATDLGRFLGPIASAAEAFLNQPVPDKSIPFSLPLSFRPSPERGGLTLIELSDASKRSYDAENASSVTTMRLFQITDLGITYRTSEKSLLLWITSLETGKPVPGASIMLIDREDRRIFAGRTDKDGLLMVKDGASCKAVLPGADAPRIGDAAVSVKSVITAIAALDDDSAYIDLHSNRFRPHGITQKTSNEAEGKTRNGHVFTERGVYRPGETVFWKSTVRVYREHKVRAPGQDKVSIEIKSPREDVLYSGTAVLNEFGTCSGSLKLKDFAPLGQYTLTVRHKEDAEAKTGNSTKTASSTVASGPAKSGQEAKDDDNSPASENTASDSDVEENAKGELLSQTGFQVQKFEPPRHFVKIGSVVKSREDASIIDRKGRQTYLETTVQGLYYTGGAVKSGKIRWTAHLVSCTSDIEGHEGRLFGANGEDRTLIESGEGMLDEKGALTIQLPLDATQMNGLYGVEIGAVVLDVDGRPAAGVETYKPKPKYRVGISRLPDRVLEGDSFSLSVVVVDEKGVNAPGGVVRLDILRKRYFYSQKRDADGNIFYRWESGWLKALTNDRSLKGGSAIFDLAFADSGDYRLQAVYETPEGEFCSRVDLDVGYVYEEEGDENSESKQRSDREITMITSRDVAAVGSSIKSEFSLTRPAVCALVTCERGDILDARVIPIDGRHASFETMIKPEFRPNVFLNVTIPGGRTGYPVYKSQVDANLPSIFYAVGKVRVEDRVSSLKIGIAPDETKLISRPGETRKLTFTVADADGKPIDAEMAVCVVDEAILSLTGYVTPVLIGLANFQLPLSVFSGDLRLSLISQELYKVFATKALTGGDMGNGGLASDLALRKDFRPVAYWNPALHPGADGKATVEFTLPDSTTAYRIYVVALDKNDAFCSTERQLVVTKEFYLQPGLPRFMTEGDAAIFPLALNNKTDKPGTVVCKIEEAKNLTAKLEPSNEAKVDALTTGVLKVLLSADNGAGEGSLTFSGRMDSFGDAIRLPLPIKPRYLPANRAVFGSFSGNTDVTFEFPAGVASMTEKERTAVLAVHLGVSTTEWSRIAPGLRYLLHYPYGCVEQTSSGIIPLAGMRKLVEQGLIPGVTLEQVDGFLKPGIARLLSMQTGSGGFSYWPGERRVNWWGSLYAVFALSSAKKAGCEVPQARLNDAVKYIHERLFGDKKKEPTHDDWGEYNFYALAAVDLALNESLTKDELGVLWGDYDKRSAEAQAFLLWTDAIVGLHPVAKQKELARKLKLDAKRGWISWHDSPDREAAAALLATMLIDPTSKKADEYAGAIIKTLRKDGAWHSTADTGWCLQALGDYYSLKGAATGGEFPVTISQVGKPPVTVTLGRSGSETALDAEEFLKNPKVVISAPGKNLVHWTLSVTYPEPAVSLEDRDHGFQVEKKIENLNGTNEIRVGDLVKVTVEFEDREHLNGEWGRRFAFLALEDPLPAGLMAVNTALKNERVPVQRNEEGEETTGDEESGEEWYTDWDDGCYSFRPDHFEMHEDRVLAFKDDLWSGRFRFTYFARAICEGDFRLRPTRLSCMYDSEIFGLTAPERFKVLPAK
ncbi:MAG: MG2 domain-containing protein [Candidatus Ozemobacteraceae bacterium]